MTSQLEIKRAGASAALSESLPPKTLRTVAEAIYGQLVHDGCRPRDIVNLSAQLLGLVTESLAAQGADD